MTANDIIRQLTSIVYQFTSGEIIVRMNGKEVDYRFEVNSDENGYYINMIDNGQGR